MNADVSRPAGSTTKVLAIIGYTRSGSTLLDSMLGEIDGFFSTGELHYLWQRGLLEQRRCGCGRAVSACEVWSAILTQAFGDRVPDPSRVMTWQDRSVRTRHTSSLVQGKAGILGSETALRQYRSVSARLYSAIAQVTGARVIIDSSKRPSDGAFLTLLPQVDPYYVHLVRDPRAIVFSWKRQKRELDSERRDHMPRQPLLKSAVEWTGVNLAAEIVRRSVGSRRVMLLRYEDLMRAPAQAVISIAHLVGEPLTTLSFLDGSAVRLGENHMVAGNPARFARGSVLLHPDVEWETHMRPRDRWLTAAMTSPLLSRYGYAMRTHRRSGTVLSKQ